VNYEGKCVQNMLVKKMLHLETVNPLWLSPGLQDSASGEEILVIVLHKLPQEGSQ